jgi:hypothetical protein
VSIRKALPLPGQPRFGGCLALDPPTRIPAADLLERTRERPLKSPGIAPQPNATIGYMGSFMQASCTGKPRAACATQGSSSKVAGACGY